jgi:hypothetical protein
MKISKFGTMTAAMLTVSAASVYAQNLTLNYGPLTGSAIIFGGSSHTFNFTQGTVSASNPNGNQFDVTGETLNGNPYAGTALGVQGDIFNGPFTYGAISGSAIQTASVLSPSGTLDIYDGLGGTLSGTVNFIDITTVLLTGGQINDNLVINLTGISYNGMNPDLAFVNANQPGELNVSFQFSPGETLTQLSTGAGGAFTSYNGSISVTAVPEPTTLAMSGLGALAALGLGFRSRKNS